MSVPARTPMTVEAFLAWLDEQPEGTRYELVAGEPVAMAPERVAHARLKARIWRALSDATEACGLPCEALPDGMTVKIDEHTAYEPDGVLQCGEPLPDEAVIVPQPLIVIEVLSPSTRGRDAGAKLDDYFRLPSVQHYLLVKTERRTVIHHRRRGDGGIDTRIVTAGDLHLDPPGLTLDLDWLYAGVKR
jgi:Uma2 family endonuclease